MFEDGNPDDTRGGTLDPNRGEKPADGSDGPGKQRWKLKVHGQEMVVEDESKAIELMQKGAAYERSSLEVKEERRKIREEHAKTMQALEPWIELDKRAREDPAMQRRIQAAISGAPMPEEAGDTDDPYQKQINHLAAQNARLMALVEKRVGGVHESVDKLNRNEQFRAEERVLKNRYGKWATDEALDDAREFAMRHGLDLATAFKAVTYDDMPERVRKDVIEEFDIDPASLTPARSEVPTIEGLGPLTPEAKQKLYSDPDLYGRFKAGLRDARRRETGKLPLPR